MSPKRGRATRGARSETLTPRFAAGRADDAVDWSQFALKVSAIRAIDAKLMRETMEEHLEAADKKSDKRMRRQFQVALGRMDHLIEHDRLELKWDKPIGKTPADAECGTLTTDSDGLFQLWDTGRKVNPYWREKTH